MACGIAGLSVVADSLSAMRYAKVSVIRDDVVATDFNIEGDYPAYGNNDERVDSIASGRWKPSWAIWRSSTPIAMRRRPCRC